MSALPLLGKAIDNITKRSCNAPETVSHLSTSARSALDSTKQNPGVLFTPFKQLGISGWSPTGCAGQGEGILAHDAAHSSDQMWTIDLELVRFDVDGVQAPAHRYIRIELDKDTPANSYADKTSLKKGDRVFFRGPIVFDNDPPRFLAGC